VARGYSKDKTEEGSRNGICDERVKVKVEVAHFLNEDVKERMELGLGCEHPTLHLGECWERFAVSCSNVYAA